MNQAEIESGRADFALKAVQTVKDKESAKTQKEYKSYVRKFPTYVLTNGLAASLAFCLDKGGAYDIIRQNIADWLKKPIGGIDAYVCTMNSDEYRIATNEVLRLFEWLRRFASGLIEGESAE